MNPLEAILKAPGVRMIPLTYVAGNLVAGPRGWRELASHPLMTALDVLPVADEFAASPTSPRRQGGVASR